jgi:hypothetical protein
VSDAVRDHALRVLDEGDPEAVAGLIGSTLRPPKMSNTDGEELVFHELTWELEGVDDVPASLRGAGFKVDRDQVSLVRDSKNQKNTVIASGSVRDGQLVMQTNSDERADELIALMRQAMPGALLLDRDVREFDEVMAAGGPTSPSSDRAATGLTDDQQRAVLTQLIAEYEQRWLDEPVPALRGMTPRDAAADPIGRTELLRLLDSFPDTDDPTAMSARRLRRRLDL